MSDVLTLEGVSKTYAGSNFSLKNVSFSLPAGCIMGLIGANDSGKSTTIGCILGALQPDRGSIQVLGCAMDDGVANLRDAVGTIYDSDHFPGHLTARQMAVILRELYSRWDDALYDALLKQFAIDPEKKINTYSKSMTMTLAIIVALAHRPELLIFDEVLSELDTLAREKAVALFQEFVKDGRHAILLSSHFIGDVEHIADILIFLHEGQVLLCEEKAVLHEQYGVLRCCEERFSELDTDDIIVYRREDSQIQVLVSDVQMAQERYPEAIIDHIGLDDIMNLLMQGERYQKESA